MKESEREIVAGQLLESFFVKCGPEIEI